MKTRILAVLSLLAALTARATPLSKEALYHRCYGQLTGQRPADDDAALAAFKGGAGDPIAECLGHLDKAKLDASGAMIHPTSVVGRLIMGHLHNTHSTFFQTGSFQLPLLNGDPHLVTGDLVDPTSPALFITQALLTDGARADSILTGKRWLLPVRTENDPTHAVSSGAPKKIFGFSFFPENQFRLAPTGPLIGIETGVARDMKYYPTSAAKTAGTPTATVRWGDSEGGGYIGTHAYLMKNVDEAADFSSNLFRLPRRWSKAVANDVLCRQLPLIRVTDGDLFVDTASPIAFRNSRNCTQCHATMDRMATTLRGFSYFTGYHQNTQHKFPVHYKMSAVTLGAESGWPAVADDQFAKRPPNGTLYFRTATDGSLVNIPVSSVDALGNQLKQQDDFFVCLANRYWNAFTGKGVTMADHQVMQGYSTVERARFEKIKTLGLGLKSHQTQSLRWLIEQILRSPDYADSAFGE